jgi:hypothetical protein
MEQLSAITSTNDTETTKVTVIMIARKPNSTVDSLESKILNLQGQLQALREQRDKAANVTA